jgi:hypothetical protein
MSQKKKTSKSFSPYNIHSLPDGSYQFFTDSNIEYKCILSISSSSFIDFPLEAQNLDFSFYPIKKGRASEDKRTGSTISKLIDDVLMSDQKYLITFICDDTDKKAHKRLKLFKRWFKSHNHDKVALLIELEDLFYAGIILCKTHPELPKIRSYLNEEKINFKKEKDKLFEWDEIE